MADYFKQTYAFYMQDFVYGLVFTYSTFYLVFHAFCFLLLIVIAMDCLFKCYLMLISAVWIASCCHGVLSDECYLLITTSDTFYLWSVILPVI